MKSEMFNSKLQHREKANILKDEDKRHHFILKSDTFETMEPTQSYIDNTLFSSKKLSYINNRTLTSDKKKSVILKRKQSTDRLYSFRTTEQKIKSILDNKEIWMAPTIDQA